MNAAFPADADGDASTIPQPSNAPSSVSAFDGDGSELTHSS